MGAPRCTGTRNDGEPCKGWRVPGSDKCKRHLPNPKARANAAVRAEVLSWRLGEAHDDPGEVLLRLVTQSRIRVEHYASLIEDATDAAERLKAAHEVHALVDEEVLAERTSFVDPQTGREVFEAPAVQAAKAALDRIFNLGGVAALVGHTYSMSNSGALYETGEAIRALVTLYNQERDRCASFAKTAVAAGLAERQVRLAEKQGALIADVLRAVLGDASLGLSAEQRAAAPAAIRRHLALVAS